MSQNLAMEVSGVTKRYQQQNALNNVSFDIEAGSIFVLLGPNGAGKTTLVRCATTLTRFDSGSIRINGFDVQHQPHQARSQLGLVSQVPTMDEVLTVHKNLDLVGEMMGTPQAERSQRIEVAVETLNLAQVMGQRVATLSGGFRRRADLAASLLQDPAVLFLDEPTIGLDLATRVHLWEVLRERCKNGMTIVLTTQDLNEAQDMATDGVILHQGSVVARGTVDALRRTTGQIYLRLTFQRPEEGSTVLAIVGDDHGALDATGRELVITSVEDLNGANALIAAIANEGATPIEVSIGPPPLSQLILELEGR